MIIKNKKVPKSCCECMFMEDITSPDDFRAKCKLLEKTLGSPLNYMYCRPVECPLAESESKLTEYELETIKSFLISEVFRNSDFMFDDNVRGTDSMEKVDLLSIIASLYNLLYREVTGKEYNYFFHWANKVGGWVDDEYLENK